MCWFLVSRGPSKHRQTCSHNVQLVWRSCVWNFVLCLFGITWFTSCLFIKLLDLISQVLSKHRRTCFHNAQLVWNCHVFKSREIRYAWIVGLEQTVYIVLLVWFLKVFLNIVKHVCTMLNWFRNLVFSSHVEFVMFGSLVWSKLFHVMLVYLSPGFGF